MRSQTLTALSRAQPAAATTTTAVYRATRQYTQSRPLTLFTTSPRRALRPWQLSFVRHESNSSPAQRPLTDRSDTPNEPNPERPEVPSYQMTFTCRKCLDRSTHKISKQAYHHGTTLITCPGCQNRHLISDHLKIFSDKSITLEDILEEKGQFLKKGALDAQGNVEFWDDAAEKTK